MQKSNKPKPNYSSHLLTIVVVEKWVVVVQISFIFTCDITGFSCSSRSSSNYFMLEISVIKSCRQHWKWSHIKWSVVQYISTSSARSKHFDCTPLNWTFVHNVCKIRILLDFTFSHLFRGTVAILQCLKQKFYLYQSTDRSDTDPGGQGTFYSGQKITIVIWLVDFSKDLYTYSRRLKSHQSS